MKYLQKFNESLKKDIILTSKRNRELTIKVTIVADRISEIENNANIRFPFEIGQTISRNIETWACTNNFLLDNKDTCPEKKIFGVKISDVPKNHEWRTIYPNKFR